MKSDHLLFFLLFIILFFQKRSFGKPLVKSIGMQLNESGVSQLLEDSIAVVVSEELEAMKDEFTIWPCNLL